MYEILPHTAEIGIAARGSSAEEAISEAVRGLAAILCDEDPPPATGESEVSVTADDLPGLLASVLEEALFVLDTRGALTVGARLELQGTAAAGVLLTAPPDRVRTQIKAVTYHQLSLKQEGATWRAVAYFDV